jgi:hypothetical protein
MKESGLHFNIVTVMRRIDGEKVPHTATVIMVWATTWKLLQ